MLIVGSRPAVYLMAVIISLIYHKSSPCRSSCNWFPVLTFFFRFVISSNCCDLFPLLSNHYSTKSISCSPCDCILNVSHGLPLQHVLPRVLPLGTQLLDAVTTDSSQTTTTHCHMNILRLILARFDSNLSCDLHEGDPSLTFLLKALTTEKAGAELDAPQCLAIEQAS